MSAEQLQVGLRFPERRIGRKSRRLPGVQSYVYLSRDGGRGEIYLPFS